MTVRGRWLALVLVPLLAVALWLRFQGGIDRVRANLQLAAIEKTVLQMERQGLLAGSTLAPQVGRMLEGGAQILLRTAELDPLEVGVPIARGALYSLLRRPEAAQRAYEEALALEQRPEVYANVGRAHLAAGDLEAAREAFRKAIRLDDNLRKEFRRYLPELKPPPEAPRKKRKQKRPKKGQLFVDGFESGGVERWSQRQEGEAADEREE